VLNVKQIYIKLKSIIMSEMYDALLPDETLLMPKQASSFNGDSYVANEFLKLKEEFSITNVIELGTCVGGTTKWLSENFEKVLTVEINADFRNIALQRLGGSGKVTSILGDSVEQLPYMLSLCDSVPLVFIDSHWNSHLPLFDELAIIKQSVLKPIIVIHDCKVPYEPNLGFDSYNGVDISYENIKSYLEDIYSVDRYEYYYNSDEKSTEVKRGVIYIKPKTNE